MPIYANPWISVEKEAYEIETHLHSGARWFGAAAVPAASTHYGDRRAAGIAAYQLTSGNNTWGTWLGLFGTSDTPVTTGKTFFDPHQIAVTTANDTNTYFIQFGRGATGAAALTAGTYTEFVYTPNTNQLDAGPIVTQTGRAPAGSIIWARCMVSGQNAKTIDFYVGIHEYSR